MRRIRLLVAIIGAGAGALWLIGRLLPASAWTNTQVHSTIEALGALAAVLLGFFLVYRESPDERRGLFPVALGFLAMGILDAWHGMCAPGHGFVLLHLSAALAGGLGFACAGLPLPSAGRSVRRWAPWAIFGLCFALGALLLALHDSIPIGTTSEGAFTPFAVHLSRIAFILYLIGAFWFAFGFVRTGRFEDLFFACLAGLFCLAQADFASSPIWSFGWWEWHFMRLAAYFLAVAYLFRGYLKLIAELTKHRDHLEDLVAERTRDLAEREARIVHLNAVLKGIRNVNQLIVKEKDRGRLLEGVCRSLTEGRGYHGAWAALLGANEPIAALAFSGYSEGMEALRALLERGERPECVARVLADPGVHTLHTPAKECGGCPLTPTYGDRAAMAVRLSHADVNFGILAVSIPAAFADDPEEHALLKEVAEDVAFALHGLDVNRERAKSEQDLRASETRYRTLVANIPQKIFVKDLEYRWVSMNDKFARDLGVTPEEAAGRPDSDFFPPDLAEKYHADDRRIFETGATEEFDEAYVEDGQRRVVHTVKTPVRNDTGAIDGVLGVFWDVTERKRLEEAQQRYARELAVRNRVAEVFLTNIDEEMYAAVLSVVLEVLESPFGVFGYIDENGALVVPTMTRTVWDKCEVADKTIVFPCNTWGDSTWPRALREKRTICDNQPSTRTPPGHIAIARHISHPLVHQGQAVGLLQIANKETPYTDEDLALLRTLGDAIAPVLDARVKRERQEAQLKRTLEDLARSNQELEQFAYVASHDLQEPLRMVSSYTQLLGERYEGKIDEKATKYIRYAVDGAVRMQGLINDLLAYSRVTTRGGTFEPVDSHAALGAARANLQGAIEESGAMVTNDDLPEVLADGSQLAQVFQNLVGNAIKFHGGEYPRVHVAAKVARGMAEFTVQDNGIGIDPKYADRIFVIFQRLHTRDEYPGTGIGLALCKRIVDRHGGKIWFESEPGKGSMFHFTLPVSKK